MVLAPKKIILERVDLSNRTIIDYFVANEEKEDAFLHAMANLVEGHYILRRCYFDEETGEFKSDTLEGVAHSYDEADSRLYDIARNSAEFFAESEGRILEDRTDNS